MRPGDEVSERLRLALEALAGARAADVVREAEAEARAEVKAILRGEIASAMLARSEQLLAPPGAPEPAAEETRPTARPPARPEPPADGTEPGDGPWLYW